MHIADSLYCTEETNTLESSYTLIFFFLNVQAKNFMVLCITMGLGYLTAHIFKSKS